MIKTLKSTIKDDGYLAANKDWLDSMLKDTFHDLHLPNGAAMETLTEAFYKDMASLAVYKDDYPKCIMFKNGSDNLFEQFGSGFAIIDGYGNADGFRDFCVSDVTTCREPLFARGLCNAVRAGVANVVAQRIVGNFKVSDILGENEYIRYAVPMPLNRIEDNYCLDVELIAFEHEGCVKLVIPHIDTEGDLENLRHLAGSGTHIYYFDVFHSSNGTDGFKLKALSKVLEDAAFLVKPYFAYREDLCFYG